MFKNPGTSVLLVILAVSLTSCGGYQKLLKSTDNDFKYEMAVKYYESGDYYKAEQLFDQLIPILRGTEKAEKIYYYYAYCYYNQHDYLLASYYFKRFSKSYPTSPLAEECTYMAAYCKYLDSPNYSLDQTNTYEALNELQLFINLYPESERVAECNDLIDKLRAKLEEKAYRISRLYFKMDEYQAAIHSYKNVLKEFPSTKYREEIMYDLIRANYYYAERSISEKKQERYLAAVEAYDKFIAVFPESRFSKEANAIRNDIIKNNLNL